MAYFLKKLYIENFGTFQNKKLDGLDQGLNIIYAPNEAGKSTICAFIHGVLFGWPSKSKNDYKIGSGDRKGRLIFEPRSAESHPSPGALTDVCKLERGYSSSANAATGAYADIVQGLSTELYEASFFITHDSVQSMSDTSKLAAELLTASTGTRNNPNTILSNYKSEQDTFFGKSSQYPNSLFNLNKDIEDATDKMQKCSAASAAQYGATELLHFVQEERKLAQEQRNVMSGTAVRITAAKDAVNQLVGELSSCDSGLKSCKQEQQRCNDAINQHKATGRYDSLIASKISAADLRNVQDLQEQQIEDAKRHKDMVYEAYKRARAGIIEALPRDAVCFCEAGSMQENTPAPEQPATVVTPASYATPATASCDASHSAPDVPSLAAPEQQAARYRRYELPTSVFCGLVVGVLFSAVISALAQGLLANCALVFGFLAAVFVAALAFTWQHGRLVRALTHIANRAKAYQRIARDFSASLSEQYTSYPSVTWNSFLMLVRFSDSSAQNGNELEAFANAYKEFTDAQNIYADAQKSYITALNVSRETFLQAGIPKTVGTFKEMCAYVEGYSRYETENRELSARQIQSKEKFDELQAEKAKKLKRINEKVEELFSVTKEAFDKLSCAFCNPHMVPQSIGEESDDAKLAEDIAAFQTKNSEIVAALSDVRDQLSTCENQKAFEQDNATGISELASSISTCFDAARQALATYDNALSNLDTGLNARCGTVNIANKNAVAVQEYQCLQDQKQQSCKQIIELMTRKLLLQHALDTWNGGDTEQVWNVASSLLDQMTGGRWKKICVSINQKNNKETILVTDMNESAQPPLNLSSGTKAQLYFAVKVALLLSAANVGESLPVIVDDALLTLDSVRRKQTVIALEQLAQRRQVLFFTCHEEIRNCITSAAPAAHQVDWLS